MVDTASIERSRVTAGFGARLRSHRERRGIGLEAVAQRTKIGVAILEALERDDTSRLPSGIYRRGFIRAYATAVGLDPETTLDEFLERFRDPLEEWPVTGDTTSMAVHRSFGAPVGALRLTLADEPRLPGAHALRARWPRVAAAACDLVVATALATALFAVVGLFWTSLTAVTVCYYFGGVLLVGTSPAAFLIGRLQRTPSAGHDVTAPALVRAPANPDTDHLPSFGARRYPRAV